MKVGIKPNQLDKEFVTTLLKKYSDLEILLNENDHDNALSDNLINENDNKNSDIKLIKQKLRNFS